MQKLMLSCFDHSTVMAQPWAEAGYLCYCVDINHPAGLERHGNIVTLGADIEKWYPVLNQPWSFGAFFPPCTHLAVSGARWFQGKGLRSLSEAIGLVAVAAEIAEALGCPYLIENPVSTLASYWRKPDHTFDPCDYGDGWTKKTCLWTGGALSCLPRIECRSPNLGRFTRCRPRMIAHSYAA